MKLFLKTIIHKEPMKSEEFVLLRKFILGSTFIVDLWEKATVLLAEKKLVTFKMPSQPT